MNGVKPQLSVKMSRLFDIRGIKNQPHDVVMDTCYDNDVNVTMDINLV